MKNSNRLMKLIKSKVTENYSNVRNIIQKSQKMPNDKTFVIDLFNLFTKQDLRLNGFDKDFNEHFRCHGVFPCHNCFETI